MGVCEGRPAYDHVEGVPCACSWCADVHQLRAVGTLVGVVDFACAGRRSMYTAVLYHSDRGGLFRTRLRAVSFTAKQVT